MKGFEELIIKAQKGDDCAQVQLFQMYHPLLFKESLIDGAFDEDLYQELCYRFFCCINKFKV